jgi:hypothetical protein
MMDMVLAWTYPSLQALFLLMLYSDLLWTWTAESGQKRGLYGYFVAAFGPGMHTPLIEMLLPCK